MDLVVKAGLADTLSNGGPFTVVAPTNEAFAKLPADLVKTVTSDVELLKKVTQEIFLSHPVLNFLFFILFLLFFSLSLPHTLLALVFIFFLFALSHCHFVSFPF